MKQIRTQYVDQELFMLKVWNKRLFRQAPINSVFIVFENKLSRNNCIDTFIKGEKDKPVLKRIEQFLCRLFGLDYNKFDYGKHRDSDLHNKVFFKKYIPFHVSPAPKPEMILWQNLDFVNKPIDIEAKIKSRCTTFLTGLILLVVMVGYQVGLMFALSYFKLTDEKSSTDTCKLYSLWTDILASPKLIQTCQHLLIAQFTIPVSAALLAIIVYCVLSCVSYS